MAHTVSLGYVGMGKQSVFGTPVAPTRFMRWQSMGPNADTLKEGFYRGGFTRDLEIAVKEAQYHDGKFTTWLYMDSGPALLAYFLGGTDTVSGGGPYTHTFAAQTGCPALPYITFENSQGCNQEIDRVQDCIVDQLTLTAKAGGLVTLGVDYQGAKNTAQASASSVTYETTRPATFVDGTVTFTGLDIASVDVVDLMITMKNTSEKVYTLGQVYPRVIQPGAREFDCQFTIFVPNNALYREVFFGSSGATTGGPATSFLTSLVALFDVSDAGPTQNLTITINNIAMEAATPNFDSSAKAFVVKAQGKAVLASSAICGCVAINAISTAYV